MKTSPAIARTFALSTLIFVLAASTFAQGPFLTIPIYPTGGTNNVRVADLNKDGYPDLISFELVGYGSFPIVVQLNNGDGTLGPAVSYPAAQPYDAVVADLNGDGNPDVIVASRIPAEVLVFLGNGDGTLQQAVSYPAPNGAVSVVAGDVNGDGKIDIITADGQSTISVLIGNGDGTLQAARTYTVGAPGTLVLADFNGDHKLDLAFLDSSFYVGSFSIMLGNGDGTFQSAVSYATTSITNALITADFNHDGIPDLAISTFDPSGVVDIFLGRGDGTFKAAIPAAVNLDPPGSLSAVDLNGDGILDLEVSTSGGFTVILGNGDGTFQAPTNYGGLTGFYSNAVADFDRDGHLDVATPNNGTDAAGQPVYGTSIVRGLPGGAFLAPRVYAAGQLTKGAVVGDFNGDGFLDIVYPEGILLGAGDGTFTSGAGFSAGLGPAGVAADFNNDGRLDFAFADDAPKGKVYVGIANGPGTFAPPLINRVDKDPFSVATADFNRDGNADLVTANMDSSDYSVLLGKGDGTFFPAVNHSIPLGATAVAAGDFNQDGIPDLAILGGALNILLGNGDGTFQSGVTYSAQGASIAVGDFNGDGKLDVLVASRTGTTVFPGNGDGTFGVAIATSAAIGGEYAVAADFNGDGKLDVVSVDAAVSSAGTIYVQYGNGDGTFQPPVAYPAGVFAQFMSVGDFNGDEAPDLAVGFDGGVTVELNARGNFVNTTAAPNPATLQQPVTLTSTVSASLQGLSLPTGSVTFKDGATILGSAPVVNGLATLTTKFATDGTHTITPAYSGDANFNPHIAASVSESVLSPKVNLSVSALNFGNQKVGTTSAPQSVKLTNRGSGELFVSAITVAGDYHQTNNCPASLNSNSSCTISVTFTPTKIGVRTGSVSVKDNATNSPQKVSLTGSGT